MLGWDFVVETFQVLILPDLNHHVWIYEDVQYFEFRVWSCKGAVIYLSRDPMEPNINDTTGYEIVIGSAQNTQIHLRSYPDYTLLQVNVTSSTSIAF